MVEIILISVLVLLIVVIIVGFVLFYKWFLNSYKPPIKKAPTWSQTTRYNRRLYEIIFKLRSELNADYVSIVRLHNGGFFNNEFPIRRFSVILEAHNPDKTESLMDKFKDAHISRYPDVMHNLIFLKSYTCSDLQFCEDIKFKKDMEKLGLNGNYLFLIRQIDEDRTPEAFLWIGYSECKYFTKEEAPLVWSYHNKILNLLNMVKEE